MKLGLDGFEEEHSFKMPIDLGNGATTNLGRSIDKGMVLYSNSRKCSKYGLP